MPDCKNLTDAQFAAFLAGTHATNRGVQMPHCVISSSAEYVTVTVNDLPVTAEDRWAVLLDGDTPISAVAPGETLISITAAPAIIVAAADLDLAAALVSDAFTEVADVSAVVLIDGRGIVGVWSGPGLTSAVMLGSSRTRSGYAYGLPGAPTMIPYIVRSCAFREHGTICATVSSFASKPFPMPACRNDNGLSVHDFGW